MSAIFCGSVGVRGVASNRLNTDWQYSRALTESNASGVGALVIVSSEGRASADGSTGGEITEEGGGGKGVAEGGAGALESATGLKRRGSYLAVENGNGRPSEVVLTFWLVTGAPDGCTGKATRLFKFSRGFVVALVLGGGPLNIGGGSFQPGS